jgi:hypothetical protein
LSNADRRATDFDRWLAEEFARTGEFTMLTVLVEIGETKVTPVRSTFLNVIGDEITWSELTALFASAGASWDGACFFPVLNAGGPLDNVTARLRLRELEARLTDDRLVLNEGHFFDKWGRRLKIEEVAVQ